MKTLSNLAKFAQKISGREITLFMNFNRTKSLSNLAKFAQKISGREITLLMKFNRTNRHTGDLNRALFLMMR